MGYLSDHYRPERHYMRGPGPKWVERHAVFSGSRCAPERAEAVQTHSSYCVEDTPTAADGMADPVERYSQGTLVSLAIALRPNSGQID